jgi:hypothetical protein
LSDQDLDQRRTEGASTGPLVCSPRSKSVVIRDCDSGRATPCTKRATVFLECCDVGQSDVVHSLFGVGDAGEWDRLIRCAKAETNGASSASGRVRLIQPYRSARSAEKSSAPRSTSRARPRPIRRVRCCAHPRPVRRRPRLPAGQTVRAHGSGKRRSQARISSPPAPRTRPAIEAIVTWSSVLTRRYSMPSPA